MLHVESQASSPEGPCGVSEEATCVGYIFPYPFFIEDRRDDKRGTSDLNLIPLFL